MSPGPPWAERFDETGTTAVDDDDEEEEDGGAEEREDCDGVRRDPGVADPGRLEVAGVALGGREEVDGVRREGAA
jgi:hypothetical protein